MGARPLDQDRVYGPWRQVEGYEGSGPVLLVISVLAVRLVVPRPTRNTKTRKIKSETAVPASGECLCSIRQRLQGSAVILGQIVDRGMQEMISKEIVERSDRAQSPDAKAIRARIDGHGDAPTYFHTRMKVDK